MTDVISCLIKALVFFFDEVVLLLDLEFDLDRDLFIERDCALNLAVAEEGLTFPDSDMIIIGFEILFLLSADPPLGITEGNASSSSVEAVDDRRVTFDFNLSKLKLRLCMISIKGWKNGSLKMIDEFLRK